MTRETALYEGILFDLDGTLVDSSADIARSANLALADCGREPLPVEQIRMFIGDGVLALLSRCLGADREDEVRAAVQRFRHHYRQHALDTTRPYPGMLDVLRSFRGRRLAVVSNKPEAFTLQVLEGLDLLPFFDVILGGDSLPRQKPDPEPCLEVLSRLGVSAGRSVIVGDSPQDMEAGRRAGLLACAALWGLHSREVLREAGATVFAASPSDLVSLLG